MRGSRLRYPELVAGSGRQATSSLAGASQFTDALVRQLDDEGAFRGHHREDRCKACRTLARCRLVQTRGGPRRAALVIRRRHIIGL